MEQNITGNIIPDMGTQIDMPRWRASGACRSIQFRSELQADPLKVEKFVRLNIDHRSALQVSRGEPFLWYAVLA